MWVFPEGTRNNTGQIHAFKKGAFHAAISAQLPILPVVYTHFYFLESEKCVFNPGESHCLSTCLRLKKGENSKSEEDCRTSQNVSFQWTRPVHRNFSFLNQNFLIVGRVVITVLPPIKTTGLCFDDLAQLMTSTHKTMTETFEATTKELLKELENDRSYL